MNRELLEFISGSRLKRIINDKRNFMGSKVEYAHDKKRDIYSVRMKMAKGEEYIVTMIVGPESIEMALSDDKGNVLEHLLHEKNSLVFG